MAEKFSPPKPNLYAEVLKGIKPFSNKKLLRNYPKLQIEMQHFLTTQIDKRDSIKKELQKPLGKEEKKYLWGTFKFLFLFLLSVFSIVVIDFALFVLVFASLFFYLILAFLFSFNPVLDFIKIPLIIATWFPLLIILTPIICFIASFQFSKFLDVWHIPEKKKNEYCWQIILGTLATLVLGVVIYQAFVVSTTTWMSLIGLFLIVLSLFGLFFSVGVIIHWIRNWLKS
ncbi:MAG: hypothetical protein NTX03_07345 [Bacteroidetes bacterium]|nr:hypothetical protein [Bacteroidota bacterium]